ncbi:MAG: hypothetical protein A3A98_01820 [Candidatus Staskawiczbacteria bacterium RIFCSPLOWO2_01_FULL_40_39]|uniref:IrrE N-terminal-like domain-containing protein n=1 Tax=Candidatus Staskawiczbacteria bacterium RIFCSPHIGHO2_01_FULL_39_25 TaxID=1802202 RepID=A0A1G2HR47_9BACT|nr:MAG: hypothetical protein A2730_01975 [Candidatus Staskawiczbacteria bacterium RIFCSPHIGHO2_01_FULL_39_25]OGZ72708.1 MAG: hypothetical protein A3A98_01820 [Candidatus Staskawiczbacteria bacterium RIFCSPLOWO2_01_FULL_40_39]OGZ74703.1 MAG: hypothetical protein A3I87_00745 [Candidatus Staskawiczbacteria bacterium RIFCSPLOWO2_02_FULL_39_8]
MGLKITKKGIPIAKLYISDEDIEWQAMADLITYRKKWLAAYGKPLTGPLDVDNFIKELWGMEVTYEELPQSADEESLGVFKPETQEVIIDPVACNHPKRISFTVAHEAGHLSLHVFLFVVKEGKFVGWKKDHASCDKNLEYQANLYAGSLLAPEQEICGLLKEKGLSINNLIANPIDLSAHLASFQEKFGLSRHALEIRLNRLGVPMADAKYLN